MHTIFKYKLENIDQQVIEIPLPARIHSVMEQNDDIVLYAIVDNGEDVPKIPVDILIKGTGDVVENNIGLYTSLGSVKLSDGQEVWHIFYMYIHDDRIVGQTVKFGESTMEEFNRKLPCKGGLLIA